MRALYEGSPRLSASVRDVFISYSHKDNLSLSEDQLGWVDHLHRALSIRLTQLLGRDSIMFFDKSVMSGSDMLSPKIRSEVADAKILVSIVSPGYLMSDWCNEELSQFAAAVAARGSAGTETTSRILKVIKLPVDVQLEKRAKVDLSDILGYKFYRTDPRGIASEFELDDEPQNRREFIKRVNELAYDVCRILDMLGDEKPNRAQVVPTTGKVVYIAETSSDLADEAERLRSELAQFGHAVVPQRTLPHGAGFADVAASEIAKADLSVHLVGSTYAVVPERERRSIAELQCDAGGRRSAAQAVISSSDLVAAARSTRRRTPGRVSRALRYLGAAHHRAVRYAQAENPHDARNAAGRRAGATERAIRHGAARRPSVGVLDFRSFRS